MEIDHKIDDRLLAAWATEGKVSPGLAAVANELLAIRRVARAITNTDYPHGYTYDEMRRIFKAIAEGAPVEGVVE